MEEAVDKVKRKLWSFGYACKDVSALPGLGYDLLVENEYQVKVVLKDDRPTVPIKIVMAIVDGDEISYQVCKRGTCREESSPLKIFPKVDKTN
jgi:hypothetical protein